MRKRGRIGRDAIDRAAPVLEAEDRAATGARFEACKLRPGRASKPARIASM